jgi:hypothetical protein
VTSAIGCSRPREVLSKHVKSSVANSKQSNTAQTQKYGIVWHISAGSSRVTGFLDRFGRGATKWELHCANSSTSASPFCPYTLLANSRETLNIQTPHLEEKIYVLVKAGEEIAQVILRRVQARDADSNHLLEVWVFNKARYFTTFEPRYLVGVCSGSDDLKRGPTFNVDQDIKRFDVVQSFDVAHIGRAFLFRQIYTSQLLSNNTTTLEDLPTTQRD